VARQLLDDSNIFNEVSRLDSTMDETHGSQMLTQDQSAFENQQVRGKKAILFNRYIT